MAGVFFSLPSPALFRFPPLSGPAPLAPPTAAFPFAIPQSVYAAALDVRVPLTIGAVYAASVKALNVYNRRRRAEAGGKPQPWAVARTRAFAAFVIAHNVALAVYSAWSFAGMLGGMMRSVAAPGNVDNGGWAGTVDSLCRVHGAPGFGNAVTWDDHQLRWRDLGGGDANATMRFDAGAGDAYGRGSEAGRLWNEGIAFYGWIFYLSKFYEVLDTLIILAKGKTSSVLQTYHHTGAMLAVWAGIRYMSAPIWMFVLINSGIHALMYTYYTLTAFNVRVPVRVKRTLTTMQITQFVVGSSYAVLHSFVSFTVPVTVPAGEHGEHGAHAGDASPAIAASAPAPASTAYETVYATQPCITTSGATFAVWLNVLYLTPLTVLFVNFFISSYLRRAPAARQVKGDVKVDDKAHLAAAAGGDAVREIGKAAAS